MPRRKCKKGRHSGPGYVYIMKNARRVKIGSSGDPDERLKEIQSQYPETVLEDYGAYAHAMMAAETYAQKRVQNPNVLGMKKIPGTIDWFAKPTVPCLRGMGYPVNNQEDVIDLIVQKVFEAVHDNNKVCKNKKW